MSEKILEVQIKTTADLSGINAVADAADKATASLKAEGATAGETARHLNTAKESVEKLTNAHEPAIEATEKHTEAIEKLETGSKLADKAVSKLGETFPKFGTAIGKLTGPLNLVFQGLEWALEKLREWNKELDKMGEKAAERSFEEAFNKKIERIEALKKAQGDYEYSINHMVTQEQRYQDAVKITTQLMEDRVTTFAKWRELNRTHEEQAIESRKDRGVITPDMAIVEKTRSNQKEIRGAATAEADNLDAKIAANKEELSTRQNTTAGSLDRTRNESTKASEYAKLRETALRQEIKEASEHRTEIDKEAEAARLKLRGAREYLETSRVAESAEPGSNQSYRANLKAAVFRAAHPIDLGTSSRTAEEYYKEISAETASVLAAKAQNQGTLARQPELARRAEAANEAERKKKSDDDAYKQNEEQIQKLLTEKALLEARRTAAGDIHEGRTAQVDAAVANAAGAGLAELRKAGGLGGQVDTQIENASDLARRELQGPDNGGKGKPLTAGEKEFLKSVGALASNKGNDVTLLQAAQMLADLKDHDDKTFDVVGNIMAHLESKNKKDRERFAAIEARVQNTFNNGN